MEEVDSLKGTIKQEQVHDILFNRELGWQELIYDLINTEQLDPWNVDITILAEKFLEKVQKLEEADFFVSSKVLLAAALLLRIKSEVLLNKYLKSIDEILFGEKESEKQTTLEHIELDEEIPVLVPKSPMSRFRKVTLKELMESLNKAIITENRRIKKEIVNRNALRETGISLPKRRYSIKDKITELHQKLVDHFDSNKDSKKITFTDFIGEDKEQRLIAFYPLLSLENQKKLWLHQEKHFEEIDIWLKEVYLEHNGDPFADLKLELGQELEDMEMEEKIEEALE